jgi:hypothetical protein
MTHTPGPWKRATLGGETRLPRPIWAYVLEANGSEIDQSNDANARLIAAAPALLEALELCWEFIATECAQETWHKKVHDAIALAKGDLRG